MAIDIEDGVSSVSVGAEKVVKLVPKQEFKSSTAEINEILDECRDLNFDEVIIFGIYRDGDTRVQMKRSKITSTMMTMGALEFAKQWLYQTG